MIPSINRLAELLKDNSQFNQSVRKDGDKKAKLIEEKFSHGTKEPKKKTTASRFTKSYIDFQIDTVVKHASLILKKYFLFKTMRQSQYNRQVKTFLTSKKNYISDWIYVLFQCIDIIF